MTSDSFNYERNEVRIIGRVSETSAKGILNGDKVIPVIFLTIVSKKRIVSGDTEYLETAVIPVTVMEAAPLIAAKEISVKDIVSVEGRIRTFGGDCKFDIYATKIEKL